MAKYRTIKDAEREIRALRRAQTAKKASIKGRMIEGAWGAGGDAVAGVTSGAIGYVTGRVELTQGPERAAVWETRMDLGVTVVGALAGWFLPEPYASLAGAARHASEGALSRRFGRSLAYGAGVDKQPGAFGKKKDPAGVEEGQRNGAGFWATVGDTVGLGDRRPFGAPIDVEVE